MFHKTGDLIAIAASKGGQPTNPVWYHNVVAHPETTIQMGSVVLSVQARVANDRERAEVWPTFVALYPSYEFLGATRKVGKSLSYYSSQGDEDLPWGHGCQME
jgi:deazaflavin-dependent oxidoreductase (nitroreductase family)